MTYRVNFKQTVLEELDQVFKLKLQEHVLVPLDERNREPENRFDSFGEDEVEHGRKEFERKSIPDGAVQTPSETWTL